MTLRLLAVVLASDESTAGFARRLARAGFKADLLLAGGGPVPAGSWDTVWQLPEAAPDAVGAAIQSLLRTEQVTAVLLSESAAGRELAGRLGARLAAPISASVLNLRVDDSGALRVTRIVDGGARTAELVLGRTPALVIPHPEAAEAPGAAKPAYSKEEHLRPEVVTSPVQLLEETHLLPDEMDVTEADVVVAGGKGVGGPDGFRMLAELAALLGGTLGASRVAVDAGWIPYSRQIGLTGKSVTPRLYIACGISGALHHTLGMRHSSTIIAVNSDPNAPIFRLAHVAVVADLHEFVPSLIEKLKQRRAGRAGARAGAAP